MFAQKNKNKKFHKVSPNLQALLEYTLFSLSFLGLVYTLRFFLLATAFLFSHRMGSTCFNGSVQTLRFCIAAIQFLLRHRNKMEMIPILCICDCVFCIRCNWFE